MRRIWKYKKTLIAIVLLIGAGAGVWVWRSSGSAAPAHREMSVTRGDIEVTVLATGVVQPRNRLEIKPPIAGRVEEILINEGQAVRKGQVLAWMSSSERAALLDAARAKGADELKRWEELYRATPVIAPLDGTVILRDAEPGQVFQSQDAILVMSDRLVVKAQVDETDIARVKLQQAARITLDAYPDDVIQASVGQVAFDAKTVNNVITYEIDVLPRTTPAFMRSGMTANVNFIVSSRRDVLMVPNEALRVRGGRSRVLLPGPEGGQPAEREIETGVSDGRRTEVVSGLSEGERLLAPQLARPARSNRGSSPLTNRR